MNVLRKIYCRTFQLCFRAALPFLPYREPEILSGMPQIAGVLAEQGLMRVLIVTDKGISSLGLLDGLKAALEDKEIEYVVYDGTVPNPTIENVEEARRLYLENKCQAIIGFGGGSSMDCAKAAGARIVKPHQSVNQMKGLLKVMKKLPPLFAVPTTAGTGSETTLAAVVVDEKTHHEYPINDFSLIPRYAVLDYHVTLGLPQGITATTGMDALTHAVEAYIGRSTTRHTRAMAVEAVGLIRKYLKRAYDNGQDIEARTNMLRAAYCAGIAFTQSYVGYVHGVAHSLGGQYGVPHGLANAVILPYFLEEYGESCAKRLGRLARKCGIAEKRDSDILASQKFIDWVRQMNDSMNIPRHIEGICKEDIPKMAKNADKESNPLYPVPREMSAGELEKMYYIVGNLKA
ncbi:MAG: iron-containing alcohol dehydrogenase [Lachnospiraceae bacterium]|nr:iron-containing alcohol dehydrogenase [Lachnospiraceae bacterium]